MPHMLCIMQVCALTINIIPESFYVSMHSLKCYEMKGVGMVRKIGRNVQLGCRLGATDTDFEIMNDFKV